MITTDYIYALIDPRDNQIKYVGKATNVNRRLYTHRIEATTSKKSYKRLTWLRKLYSLGLEPKIKILEEVTDGDWITREKLWIAKLKAEGFPLVNTSDGGEGMSDSSGEVGSKISTTKKTLGQRPTREAVLKSAEMRRGKPSSEAQKAASKKANTGKVMSDATKKAIGQKNKGNQASAKSYLVKTPEGDEITVTNLSSWCKERGLDSSGMCKVANGKSKTYKGYTVKYLKKSG